VPGKDVEVAVEILLSVRSKADGAVKEHRCRVDGKLVLGRGPDSAVPLEGSSLSREHLVLQLEGSDLYAIDQSSNGSWVNGGRLTRGEKRRVQPGDTLEVPGYEMRLQLAGAGGAATEIVGAPAAARQAAPAEVIEAAPAPEAPARKSPLAPVTEFLGSFTGMEWFLAAIGFAALLLLFIYLSS